MSLRDGITNGEAQGPVFEAQVNKGRIQMSGLTDHLNARFVNGYELSHIYEQNGNTVVIWRKMAAARP